MIHYRTRRVKGVGLREKSRKMVRMKVYIIDKTTKQICCETRWVPKLESLYQKS